MSAKSYMRCLLKYTTVVCMAPTCLYPGLMALGYAPDEKMDSVLGDLYSEFDLGVEGVTW